MRRQRPHRARQTIGSSGFSLLEVLVASVILAVGASAVLGHVHQLLDHTRRARIHQDEVRLAINQSAELGLGDINGLKRSITENAILLAGDGAEPLARVTNHAQGAVKVPVTVGFAPFQLFTVPATGRYAVTLIGRGLRSENDGPAQPPL